MLQIGICDDVQDARLALCSAIERILEARGVECNIFEFSSGDGLLRWYEKHAGELDLVFLDIEMDGRNGMETARQLRGRDGQLQLVFVTGHPDYVFDGYSVSALDYIMKPATGRQVDKVLTRAMAALHMAAEEVYLCRNSEGSYRIPKATILFFSSEKRLVTCVARDREYTFYARLDEVENEVGALFVRIHQRYLVNGAAVEWIGRDSVEIGGHALPISRACQKTAMVALTRASLK